jgi:hypothetical protein
MTNLSNTSWLYFFIFFFTGISLIIYFVKYKVQFTYESIKLFGALILTMLAAFAILFAKLLH